MLKKKKSRKLLWTDWLDYFKTKSCDLENVRIEIVTIRGQKKHVFRNGTHGDNTQNNSIPKIKCHKILKFISIINDITSPD